MADLIPMLAAVAGQAGEEADEDFNQTVLLLHGDGTNGAQNNTFLDGSTNNFTITRNGNTTQGTFSPFSGADGYWSNFFDGTNDRLTIADNAALRPGTSAFTIEAWVYRAAAGAAHTIFAKGASTPTGFAFLITSSDTLRFTDTSTDITSTGTVAANTWVHVAAVREGTGSNQLKLYINGVQDGTGTSSTNFTQTEEARIGEDRGATDDFNGYISNFRYVIGTALYTAGFTPSTSPLTTTSQGATSSQVELLTCQSNRFVDNSTNAFAITRNGDVRVTPFSPFAPSAAYSASTNGGSGYFDGSGDYLAINFSSGSTVAGDFTWETWVYDFGTNANSTLLGWRNGSVGWVGILVQRNSGPNLIAFVNQGGLTITQTSGTYLSNQWNHVALVRSGSTVTLYVNGTSVGSGTVSGSFDPGSAYWIGSDPHNNVTTVQLRGYISNQRFVNGTALYTSTFTPPTAPLTAITNTSLLTNFTNAGIFDNTGKNNLETVGDAQIDTTTKKFGTGSMEFDGTDDSLVTPSTPELSGFNSSNWTIEAWIYPVQSKTMAIVNLVTATNANSGLNFGTNSSMQLKCDNGVNAGAAGGTISLNTWSHVAAVRSGSTITLYVNGSSVATTNQTPNATSFAYIGRVSSTSVPEVFNGFIDDLRITKGVARYTANFTAPTKAFPDQ
jgi:hypothetical protein